MEYGPSLPLSPLGEGRRGRTHRGRGEGQENIMGPKLRFEILKRDGFRCRYCGASGSAVILEVDHMIARANGGGDEKENLITACRPCNRGKGATDCDDARPHPMSGLAFHEIKNGEIDRQGMILGGGSGKLEVVYFEWFTGSASQRCFVDIERVKDFRLYANCEEMNEAYHAA